MSQAEIFKYLLPLPRRLCFSVVLVCLTFCLICYSKRHEQVVLKFYRGVIRFCDSILAAISVTMLTVQLEIQS